MALTINGTGTRFYGKRRQPDGSYLATKYVTFCWIPVYSLGEHRVYPPAFVASDLLQNPKSVAVALTNAAFVVALLAAFLYGAPAFIEWVQKAYPN